jgi:diguanylate cyclase (GGDEF)-like protein
MANILVVEDELLIARLLKETLEVEGYNVTTVLNGKDAVQFALRETPHLIIVDIMLPEMDGYAVMRQLRAHPKSMHIPILALSAFCEPEDKIGAYEGGVDGYVTKPFHTDELLAQVRRQLRRIQQSCLSPLTGLPGGLQVERAIDYKLGNLEPWSILYLDLDNFKAFNDVYGFLTGNDMILLLGQICQKTVYEYGNTDDFVGHIGGDDFVVLTIPACVQTLCSHIARRYRAESIALYRPEDLRRGSISGVDRKGRPYQFPLVSLSIGVVDNQLRQPHSIQEVSYLVAEAKRNAKQSTTNSSYILPQREQGHAERDLMPAAGSSAPFLLPAPFPFATYGHTLHDLMYFVEDDELSEYGQQVR